LLVHETVVNSMSYVLVNVNLFDKIRKFFETTVNDNSLDILEWSMCGIQEADER
jgi:hypothetical protein